MVHFHHQLHRPRRPVHGPSTGVRTAAETLPAAGLRLQLSGPRNAKRNMNGSRISSSSSASSSSTTNQPINQPLRIRYMRIEEQCGVLVGGYANEQQARQALDNLRKLPAAGSNARATAHDPDAGPTTKRIRPASTKSAAATSIRSCRPFSCRNPAVKFNRPSAMGRSST